MGQSEPFGSDADVGDTHAGHEQCGDECDDVGLLLLYQIDGDGPKGEDRKCLVAPGEVAPDDFEAVCIGQAVYECACGNDE